MSTPSLRNFISLIQLIFLPWISGRLLAVEALDGVFELRQAQKVSPAVSKPVQAWATQGHTNELLRFTRLKKDKKDCFRLHIQW